MGVEAVVGQVELAALPVRGPEGLRDILSILTRFPGFSILWFWELLGWRAQGEQDYRDKAGCKMNKSSALKPLLHPARALLVH